MFDERVPKMRCVLTTEQPWKSKGSDCVRLTVDAIVALRQPGFDLQIGGERVELHRVPPVGGRVALGIELRWP